jgi:5-methyltetrahydropteroyltriglutamate--homocysteine methyltransferase
MTGIHTLGFPRMGAHRELKFALEQYWSGKIDAAQLEETGRELRARHWQVQADAGLSFVTVGDFAFYDHVANHVQLFGCEPARFGFTTEGELERYFVMARGAAGNEADGIPEQHALEMTKWFDTNYHYLVPEFTDETRFQVACERLFTEVAEAQRLGYAVKVALVGPFTFLRLGKSKEEGFQPLSLLEGLLAAYEMVLSRLRDAGVEWVQIDEPILGLDLSPDWALAFPNTYTRLSEAGPKLLLTTYFSPLRENLVWACALPVAGLHIDAVRAPEELEQAAALLPAEKVLSAGIVDGRNIWRADLDAVLARLSPIHARRGEQLWLAPSCSLLHVPFSLKPETDLDPDLKSWLAFATEKLRELGTLQQALDNGPGAVEGELAAARAALENRQTHPQVRHTAVSERIAGLAASVDQRTAPFPTRREKQRQRFGLPAFPTTTIGSFPQTREIRAQRAAFRRGELDAEAYKAAMHAEIERVVRAQEELGLDVLVHGEAERNDMVEYFGEQLAGFAFTRNGWVQSYGSRCVKPPILFGDVWLPQPMTREWSIYAQSLTQRPMKGMLTGPVTILHWSFVRDDQPRSETCLQIALAIRDEVADLENAGLGIIQIDEPALREGLPLRREEWEAYLAWAARAFRVAAGGAAEETQVHTHMCYAEFHDILPAIAALDADVITIESSRSEMELLEAFQKFRYPGEIGPGVWDVHSPVVPTVEEMVERLRQAAQVLPADRLWVNPDCGLKTRAWPETEASLRNLVAAAHVLRLAE